MGYRLVEEKRSALWLTEMCRYRTIERYRIKIAGVWLAPHRRYQKNPGSSTVTGRLPRFDLSRFMIELILSAIINGDPAGWDCSGPSVINSRRGDLLDPVHWSPGSAPEHPY